MHLSVVIPCFNEESRIGKTLAQIDEFLASKPYSSEIIPVNDGSCDSTERVIAQQQDNCRVPLRLMSYSPNKGKGHAVRRGIMHAEGEFILFTDADLSTPISELDEFLEFLEAGEADIVIGSRGLPESDIQVHQPKYRELMGKTFNLLVRCLAVPSIKDTQCGFKCFRREVAKKLFCIQKIDGFAFDVEVLVLARQFGYRVIEKPVRWINSPSSRVHPIRDSSRMLWELLRIRINQLRGVYRT